MTRPDVVRMSHPVRPGIPEPEERITSEPKPVTNTRAHPVPDARPIVAAAALLRDAAAKFEKHIASIDPAPFTPEGLHNQIGAFAESPAAQQIDDAIGLAAQREADAEAHVADVLAKLSPQGDVAAELRSTRAWNRAQRQLDAVPSDRVPEMARTLIANADDAELGVLLQELPSFLASKGQASDWLTLVVAERLPELADAQRKLKLARQARPQIEFDAQRLRDRITKTTAPKAYEPVPFLDLGHYDPDA